MNNPTPDLTALDSQAVEARSLPVTPASPADVRTAAWRLDDLWLPAVTLSRDALEHNLDRFARWCHDRGVDLAPHGKTTMAPQMWSAQLGRGAWAISAATVAQARIMRRYGVPRVLIANEVTEPAQLRWLATESADPGFEVLSLVDSLDGVETIEYALAGTNARLDVLVELGVPGRRTGVRGVGAAYELAQRVARSPHLRLVGVEGYEGVFPQARDGLAEKPARTWLRGVVDLVGRVDAAGLFADAIEIVVTAGGSGYPDLVADAFAEVGQLSRPHRGVIRSGCYLTHDDLSYERTSPLRSTADPDPLSPALSCFARVISAPEPGRVLLGVGKRDISFDIDLPVVRALHRKGERVPLEGRATVIELNDHHGFADIEPGLVGVGEVIELGLSHPCTVFDKWQLIPVLDGEDRVIDAIRTIF